MSELYMTKTDVKPIIKIENLKKEKKEKKCLN